MARSSVKEGQAEGQQQLGTVLTPTCTWNSSPGAGDSGLSFRGAPVQGGKGWRPEERWSEKIRTKGALRGLTFCDYVGCYFRKKHQFSRKIISFHFSSLFGWFLWCFLLQAHRLMKKRHLEEV